MDQGTVIVDAGANVDCKPGHLVQFGLMGSIYAERILGVNGAARRRSEQRRRRKQRQ